MGSIATSKETGESNMQKLEKNRRKIKYRLNDKLSSGRKKLFTSMNMMTNKIGSIVYC